jgi:integrator complex subunit 1
MSDNPATSTNTPLKMIHAVYNVFPKKLSATGMAHAFMSMLVSSVDEELTQGEKVKRLRALIRTVANELGPALDAGLLIQSLMETKEGNSLEQQHDKARLLFQCATLVARRRVEFSKKTKEASSNELLKETLIQSKRCLLQWCCRSYASVVVAAATTNPPPSSAITTNKLKLSPGQVGAGPADYSSILDGLTDHKFPFWLTVMRSVLFLEKANSIRLKEFLLEEDDLDQEEAKRIELCYTLGGDLDNDMIWTILESLSRGEMPPKMALTLLEHLFESCQKQGQGKLVITDVNILRELYTLVPYVPPKSLLPKQDQQIDVEIKDADDKKNEDDNDKLTNRYTHMNTLKEEIPQLAYPGMWWRVTGLALIICGTAPQDIGAVAWKEHPTLRALIKMVTSDRYRFPTVDCDVTARDEMLKTEQAMRGREAKITEALFGNTNKHAKSKRKKMIEPSLPRGSRMSKRQKEKREKQLKKQREKEAAAVAAEANRRKKMLRAAQKSIMLWDPTGGARKPPKESVDLILSVSELFDLPRAFQQTTEPDFLLLTIGNTTRGAIERAYDWLIPIVSFLPTTIARLPASASCFLLLRAYGTEGEERAQLQELSVPLLVHVRDSLTGKFGEANAVRAFDLLLTDAASHNPDRRRCARRVLHDAIGKDESISLRSPEQDIETFQNTNYAWMIKMLSVEHTSSVISDAIKCIYRAASFERGRTLRFHVVALQHLTNYAIDKKIGETWNYPSMLIDLISKRPTVFAATMGSFPDLQSMAIRIAHDEFRAYIISDSTKSKGDMQDEATVKITLYNEGASSANHANGDSKDDGTVQATLPLSLLQSSCVLLSIYLDDDKDLAENQTVRDLVKMLMREEQAYQDGGDGDNSLGAGLSSARIAGSGKSIVPVESVSTPEINFNL